MPMPPLRASRAMLHVRSGKTRPRFRSAVASALALTTVVLLSGCENNNGITTAAKVCAVTSLSVAPSTLSVSAGSTGTLQAALSTTDCTTQPSVNWSSSTPSVASVDGNGIVTALVPGTATITAASLSATGSATVTVTAAPVATVEVALTVASPLPGQQSQASAILRSSSGTVLTGRPVTWSSANAAVAFVDNIGGVIAVAPGTTTITATAEGRSGSATITVQPFPVASVSLTVANATMRVGETQVATAAARDGNGAVLPGRSIAWSSSNTAVASVSASGSVTALSVGTAAISASSEGQFASVALTVTPNTASVDLSLAQTTLIAGQQTQATAEVRDAAGNALTAEPVTFASSNVAIATVSSTGLVTSVAPGTANISATSGSISRSVALTVTPVVAPIAAILLTPATANLQVGATTQLSASPRDAMNAVLTGRTITFTSSATAVAAVSVDGVVTAVSPGSATITASAEGVNATAAITVTKVPTASVTITTPSSTANVGGTLQASVTIRDANNAVVTGVSCTLQSSNTSIATVSASGLVTAIGVGSASISATCDGVTGNLMISVVGNPTLSITAATPSGGATALSIETTFQLTFSENINASTVSASSVTLTANGVAVPATRTVSTNRITIAPTSLLTEYNTEYTVTVTTALRSAAGNSLPASGLLTYTTDFWDPNYVYRVRNRFAGDASSLDTFSDSFAAFMGETGGFTGQFWYFIARGGGFYSMQNLFGGPTRGLEGADTGTRPFLTTGGLPNQVDFSGMLWRAVPLGSDNYLLRPASTATKSLATEGGVPQLFTSPGSAGAGSSFAWYFTREFRR